MFHLSQFNPEFSQISQTYRLMVDLITCDIQLSHHGSHKINPFWPNDYLDFCFPWFVFVVLTDILNFSDKVLYVFPMGTICDTGWTLMLQKRRSIARVKNYWYCRKFSNWYWESPAASLSLIKHQLINIESNPILDYWSLISMKLFAIPSGRPNEWNRASTVCIGTLNWY